MNWIPRRKPGFLRRNQRRLSIAGYNWGLNRGKSKPAHDPGQPVYQPVCAVIGHCCRAVIFFQEWLDGIAIIAVIVINAVIGFLMEFQAERSMEALKKLTTVPARVLRDGTLGAISSEELVPGDILFVEGGDMVTADARLISSAQLQSDESALTGESLPVEKQTGQLLETVPLAERDNMLYKGTFVTKGNGFAVVVRTGMATRLGTVARMVQQAQQSATPLEKKIQKLSKNLLWITVGAFGCHIYCRDIKREGFCTDAGNIHCTCRCRNS